MEIEEPSLTDTQPARIRRATARARSKSAPATLPARPNSVSLAIWMVLIHAVVAQDCKHRAENLLARDHHVVGDCTMVLKPSQESHFSAHILAEIFHAAGVPAGVFNLIQGKGSVVGGAGRERGEHFHGHLVYRPVPRRDHAADADRLLHDPRCAALFVELKILQHSTSLSLRPRC
jgi:Aldehyde dehydrogenase family